MVLKAKKILGSSHNGYMIKTLAFASQTASEEEEEALYLFFFSLLPDGKAS